MDRSLKAFTPIRIGAHTLKNRIEVAPHGSALHDRDGGAGPKLMAYLRNQARGGAGLITIGSGNIGPVATGYPVPHPADPMLIGSYAAVAEMMHMYGTKVSMQIYPSREMRMPSEDVATGYSKEQLREMIQNYANAAYNLKTAGFDFIMIHGGHGNGPAMFFSELFNHRSDEYGGSLYNRARFGIEVLEAIREKCGDDLGIEYRISAEEITPGCATLEETIEYAKLIQDKIDMIHISRGMLEEDSQMPDIFTPIYYPHRINLPYAKKFREALDIPVNVIGGFTLEQAVEAIEAGDVDMVAMCRSFIADPLCVEKALSGREDEIRPCVRCNTCINQTHARLWDIRCAVNPVCGREVQTALVPAPRKAKKVVMVGGGPGNLEAARTAAARGHSVVLFEQNSELGGSLRLAAAPDFKADMKRYLDWSIRMTEKDPRIEIRLNTKATRELVEAEQPDAVFIGIGAQPVIPAFSDAGTERLVWAGDVLTGKAQTGQSVAVAGCGFTGLETALLLARQGKTVTVVDMLPAEQIGGDAPIMSMVGLRKLLDENGVQFVNDVKVLDVKDGTVFLESTKDGSRCELAADTCVLSLGMKKSAAAAEEFAGIAPETRLIGDCSEAGGVLWKAVRTGFDWAMEL